jgi:uncharacterized protein (TIGR03437 family)
MVILIAALLLAALTAAAQTSVVTYHNDNARTGQYLSEILLTPANVKPGSFGKRFSLPVDGAVYAQPLYLPRVKVAGKGLHNVLYVATGHDSLYAFDADDNSGANAQPLWKASFIDPARGIEPVPADDVGCQVIWPELGIVGTPVIDAAAGTIYLIAETKEPQNQYVFRLHAIDVTSGAERSGSPVVIQPPGFIPLSHKQRTALLLSKGVVYSSWGSNCDLGNYHGWVLAHDARTLKPVGVFNDSPDGNASSFWNGGAGPAADADGNIYVVSANGDFTAGSGGRDYGDSVVKLSPSPRMSVTDFFTPFNQDTLNLLDVDLGSTGVVLLPDAAGSPAHPHLLFTVGKEGRLYLLDRDDLGRAQQGSDASALASLLVLTHSVFGTAAYFNGSIYMAPELAPLVAFPVAGAVLRSTPSATASNSTGVLGASPSLSANGSQNGIVWIISSDSGGTLRAYDAANLTELYNSNALSVDRLGVFTEFSVPTVAASKVYAGTAGSVAVYGELASDPPAIAAVTNAASYSTTAISPGALISLFGSGLAPDTATTPGVPLPLSLADVAVTINGVPAPVLYVSAHQVNAQVPFGILPGPATVVVRVTGVPSPAFTNTVQPAAPGIFTHAQGQAAVLNADGSVNTSANPAVVGTIVSLFLTGQGPVAQPVEDGDAPAAGTAVSATLPASATIGGVPADVRYAGLAPLYPGLAQMNLQIPPLASGTYPVVVKIGGVASNAAQLTVIAAH